MIVVRTGQSAQQLTLSSPQGQVLSASYTHSGTREALTLTLLGKVIPPIGTLALFASGLNVTVDADPTQYEYHQGPAGFTTILYGYNKKASRLGSLRLPELVPWVLSPTPPPDRYQPCSARRPLQSLNVTSSIQQAFAQAGMTLTFVGSDPLSGQSWKEKEREYTTLGKTPDQLFAEAHGQLGYTYVVRDAIAYALAPGQGIGAATVQNKDLEGVPVTRGEAANVPSRITLTGAPLLADKINPLSLLASAPDANSLSHEVLSDVEWYVTTPTAGGETIKGFRKAGGVVTATAELTLSDVTATETVNGVITTRTFSHVVTGFTSTTSLYDPNCSDAMIRQDTVKKTYSYTLGTNTQSAIFGGPGFIGSYEAGDSLADESQTIFQTFSGEGYLSARTTNSTKLVSVQQTNPDGPLAARGPMQAKEYARTVLSENFAPVGGQWLRTFNLSGAQQLPLYDQTTGDAVRLTTRGGTFSSAVETLDAAPAQVRCPDPCGAQKIAYPQVLTAVLPDGREGQERQANLPMVADNSLLVSLMLGLIVASGPSITASGDLAVPQDYRPGTVLSGSLVGVVQTFTLDAQNGLAHTKVTVRKQLDGSGSFTPTIPANGEYRDQVLWRSPGGVVVNHMKAIVNGVPTFDQVFVRVTGANLPNSGDEITWRTDARFGPTATGNYGG